MVIDGVEIACILAEIEENFRNGKIAQSRNEKIYSKQALWVFLNNFSLDSTSLVIPSSKTHDLCCVDIPEKLGDFLRETAGNSFDIAMWILKLQLQRYDPIFEADKYKELYKRLFLLSVLRIIINNSMKNPDHHDPLDPLSRHEHWEKIYRYYQSNMNINEIYWDINGLYRYKNFPHPKGKRLKKSLLLNRCLLCHNPQTENKYLCQIHSSNSNSTNKEKKKVEKWIRDAYSHLQGEAISSFQLESDIFIKSYELHTWAKWHPIHKEFRKLMENTYLKILEENDDIGIFSSSSHKNIRYALEKAYRKHPFIDEFNIHVNIGTESLLDTYYSILLESEHTLIKIAAKSTLRKKYNFNEQSSIDPIVTIYRDH